MRFVKPSKGFSLSKNLGMLLFYTAVVSGSLTCSKEVYALEAPSLPPSVLMASTNKSNGETNTTSASKKVVKPAETKTQKALTNEVKAKSVSEDNTASKNTSKNVSVKETEVIPAPVVKQVPDTEEKATLTPSTPPSLLVNSVMNQEKVSDSDVNDDDFEADADDDFSIKGNEPKPASNLIASAKIVEKESSSTPVAALQVKKDNSSEKKVSEKKQEVKPVEKKEASKPTKAVVETSSSQKVEAKPAEKPIVIASAKKEKVNSPVQKTSAKPEVKKPVAEKESKAEVKKVSKVRKVSKKIVEEEDNVCPPEWDWFSAPLVFVRDANGKLVLMADKNAPKIVIGKKTSSNNDEAKTIKPVKAENKAQVKKSVVVKTVKKAEPKEEEYVEAKPIEAPATPVTNIEPQTVDEKAVVEVKEEAPEINASDAKPVVMIKKTEPETKSMFAEAVQKMARIKRLHSYEANNKTLNVASVKRPASMVRLNKFIGQLIRRTEKKSQKDDRMLKAEVTPQAPPATNKSSVSSEEPSSEDSGSNSVKYAFRPYINNNFSGYYSSNY